MRNGGDLVKFQIPGVQQAADHFFRQVRQEDDADVRAAVVHVLDDGVHPRLLDGVAVAAARSVPQQPQKGVLGEGIALGGYGETGGSGGVPALSVELFDAPLLLQQGDGIAQKFLSLGRELHAPVAADEELDAQLLLQLPHGGGDAGLG